MAYWPQLRNSGHEWQSCAIFSGTQVCGTIEKPRRTKNAGSCANAHRRVKPSRRARAARSSTIRDAEASRRASRLTTSERTSATAGDSGASSAQPTTRSPDVVSTATTKRGAWTTSSSSVRGSRRPSSRWAAISACSAGASAAVAATKGDLRLRRLQRTAGRSATLLSRSVVNNNSHRHLYAFTSSTDTDAARRREFASPLRSPPPSP